VDLPAEQRASRAADDQAGRPVALAAVLTPVIPAPAAAVVTIGAVIPAPAIVTAIPAGTIAVAILVPLIRVREGGLVGGGGKLVRRCGNGGEDGARCSESQGGGLESVHGHF